jgi:hypothetical protein
VHDDVRRTRVDLIDIKYLHDSWSREYQCLHVDLDLVLLLTDYLAQ